MTYGHSNAAAVWDDWDSSSQSSGYTSAATAHAAEDAAPVWLPTVKANLEHLLS